MNGWRPMRVGDLDAVLALAGRVHPGLTESRAVFAERLALFPAGCLVFKGPGGVAGYAVSHPIRHAAPPPLDTLLGALPGDPDAYYIHDLVVAPEARGAGAAAAGVARLLERARRFPATTLVSVYGTAAFWSRFGFLAADYELGAKLAAYGPDAVYMVRHARPVRT